MTALLFSRDRGPARFRRSFPDGARGEDWAWEQRRGDLRGEGRELLDGAPGVSSAPALRLIAVFWLPAGCSRDRLCVLDLGKAF